MPGAKALWHERLDALTQQLVARVAEQLLCLRVDENDLSVAADDDHRVGRGFEQAAELRLARSLFTESLELRDVLLVHGDEPKLARPVAHRALRHVDIDALAVLADSDGLDEERTLSNHALKE